MTKINCRADPAERALEIFCIEMYTLLPTGSTSNNVVCSNYSEGATKERMGVPAPSDVEGIMTGAQYGNASSIVKGPIPPLHTYLYTAHLHIRYRFLAL